RDGLKSECVMFYTYADTRKHEFFINQIEDGYLQGLSQDKLDAVIHFASLATCRKKYLLAYFGEDLKQTNCGGCDVCLPGKKETTAFEAKELPKNDIKKIELEYNQELFEELRALRKVLAAREHVPPFIIFGDAALQEMACYLPTDQEAFACINGVGAKKLQQYGDIFLGVINNFLEKNNL
ncbi:MAG: HRDC domain-containing protein, partial [Candidatus Gribaldobacteria bacterium]|nr:HRDC domain-containing protein [Candidatus Gribaldobacteria bacterium]